MQLRSHTAMVVVQGGSCSSNLTLILGTSICYKSGPKKKEKKKKKREKIYLKKLWLKIFKTKEESRYPDTGSTEGPKQDETKQTYTKTQYLKNGKFLKIKRRFSRHQRKRVNYKGTPIRLSADFSTKMLKTRGCANIYSMF